MTSLNFRRWLGVILLLVALPAITVHAADWTLRRDDAGIQVFTRPVAGSGIEAFRGETVIPATVEAVRSVLREVDRFPEWFPDCPEARTLSRDGDVELRYTVTSTPWPVEDRDAIYRFITKKEPDGSVTVEITAAPDSHPVQAGRVRIREAKGLWHFVPAPGGTAVTFQLHLEPGGSVPAWLTNNRVVETPYKTLDGLRKQVETRAP